MSHEQLSDEDLGNESGWRPEFVLPATVESFPEPDLHLGSEITDFVYQRATTLENALSRIRQTQVVLSRCNARDPKDHQPVNVEWTAQGKTQGQIDLTDALLQGMKKIAVTLYTDLKAEGKGDIANDLLDQHRGINLP